MIWAWMGAAAVGVSLGLLGSGGAILTVPILVYLVGHDEKIAIGESLAIVGAISVAGVIRAALQHRVDFRSAALLAFPGIAGTLAGAHAAGFVPGAIQLVLLAVLMLAAAEMMFRRPADVGRVVDLADEAVTHRTRGPFWVIMLQGFGLGVATGLVGVGGGFLIVPVLVLMRGLSMQVAVGTSLAIIAVNCASGLVTYLSQSVRDSAAPGERVGMDWAIVGVFIVLGVAGSLVGNALAGRINQRRLTRIFAVFLVVMAGYIFVRQAPRVVEGISRQASPEIAPQLKP